MSDDLKDIMQKHVVLDKSGQLCLRPQSILSDFVSLLEECYHMGVKNYQLDDQKIDLEKALQISTWLPFNAVELSLQNNPFTDTGLNYICSSMNTLTSLNISNTMITDNGIFVICRDLSNLERLYVNDNNISDVGFIYIFSELKLEILHIEKNKVTDVGVIDSHWLIPKHMISLRLNGNLLTSMGTRQLCKNLNQHKIDELCLDEKIKVPEKVIVCKFY